MLTFIMHSNYPEMGPGPKHGFMWARQTEGIRRYMVYKQSEHFSFCSVSDSPGSLSPIFFLTTSPPSGPFFFQRPLLPEVSLPGSWCPENSYQLCLLCFRSEFMKIIEWTRLI